MRYEHIITFLLATALVLVVVIAYSAYMQPRLELRHGRMIDEQMAALRDRAKGDPPDRQALNSMIQALHSGDAFERTAAAAYLGQVGSAAEPAVDALVEALNGTDLFTARHAALSLGEIGPAAGRAIPDLINAVRQHPDADIGWFSAESLGRIADPNDQKVIAVLEEASNSSDESMKRHAVSALRNLESRRTSRSQ